MPHRAPLPSRRPGSARGRRGLRRGRAGRPRAGSAARPSAVHPRRWPWAWGTPRPPQAVGDAAINAISGIPA